MMIFSGIAVFLLASVAYPGATVYAQTFSRFVSRVHAMDEQNRAAVVDSFLRTLPAFPFIENDTTAHFLYTGNASSVSVPGDMNNWSASAHPMQRLSTTALWYRTATFEPDARLDYKYVVDGTWVLDTRNPRMVSGGFGPNSELRMPRCPDSPEIVFDPGIRHGTLLDTTLTSASLGSARRIRVYIPPGYDESRDRYPVVVFHDGLEYISLAQADNTLDHLIAHAKIKPIIAVFVPPVNRTAEYAGSQMAAFARFLIDDVLGYVDARFRTRVEPSARATIGASNGGNISLYLATMHPEIFGLAAAQSSNILPQIADRFASSDRLPLRIYLDVGTYDIPALIPMARSLAPVLASKGYDHVYREHHEGHSWGNWRAHIDDALIFLIGAIASGSDHGTLLPHRPELEQNYPNPFPSSTVIPLTLAGPGEAVLRIRDMTGAAISTFRFSDSSRGETRVHWDARNVPAGPYLCELLTRGHIARRLMIKL